MGKVSQIAEEVGVSAATVSRALSRPEMVAKSTRERILNKAKELGIDVPMSRSVGQGQGMLGVIVADLNNTFSAGILKSITALAQDDGLQVLLGVTNENQALERKIIADMNQIPLYGMIAMPTGASTIPLIECRNVVAVDRPFVGRDTKCALINNEKVVKIAYDHLNSKGHKHIVYLSGKSTLYTFKERLNAAQAYDNVECIELDALEYNDLYTKAFEITNILLTRHSGKPTAILTSNNAITSGVAYALSLRNVVMPRDMALVSIGDPEWCRFFPTPITTVKLPEDELGAAAYEILKHNDVKCRLIDPMLLPRASS